MRYLLILTNKCYSNCKCTVPYGIKRRTFRSAYSRMCPTCGADPSRNCAGAGLNGKQFCPERIDPNGYYASNKNDSCVILDVEALDEAAALAQYRMWCSSNGEGKNDLPTIIAAFRIEPIAFDGDALRDERYAELVARERIAAEDEERKQLAKLKAKYEGVEQ